MADNGSMEHCEIALLVSTCNKYEPGEQKFYLQSVTPLKDGAGQDSSVTVSNNNLTNKDSSSGTSSTSTSSSITLTLPKDISRWYPKKWIPPGTRFIVAFIGGDITKPHIIGRDF